MLNEAKSRDKISGPKEFQHLVHVDGDFRWFFDNSVKSEDLFQPVKLIGKGGFGKVYQMLHCESQLMLAGKVINPSLMSKENRELLKNEILLMKDISSPFTVRYCGCISYQDSLMILMEYCDRGSIRDLIDSTEKNLDEPQIAFILKDVLLALDFLHNKQKTIHRDIKAGNILLNSKGAVKITDFGVSRKFGITDKKTTMKQVGSPYWVSPEVINHQEYGFPADIWSLGATLCEMAEGNPPLFDLEPSPAMVFISTNGWPGFKNPSKFSEEFVDFVRQCMQLKPEDRPQIAELLQHPFLSKYKGLKRAEVLKPLLESDLNFSKIFDDEEEEEEDMFLKFSQSQQNLRQFKSVTEIPQVPEQKEQPGNSPVASIAKFSQNKIQLIIGSLLLTIVLLLWKLYGNKFLFTFVALLIVGIIFWKKFV